VWQQAKRLKEDPKVIKKFIQEVKTHIEKKKEPLIHKKQALKKHHCEKWRALKAKQEECW